MAINPILYQNEINKVSDIQKDYKSVCNHVCPDEQNVSIFDMLPPSNRLTGIEKDKDNHKKLANAGLATMALMNLPEDIRDLSDVVKQIKSEIKGDNSFKQPYDYSKAQHPFSLFRGSLMRKLVNPETTPFPKLAAKLRNADKTMLNTDFGRKYLEKNNINVEDVITDMKEINYSANMPSFVIAKNFSGGNPFTELTARALVRTPQLGALAYGAIEVANCAGNIMDGDNPFKAGYNSAIDFTTSMVGMGYGGAFGAKHFGAAGSVIGMGIGTILGKLTAKELKIN